MVTQTSQKGQHNLPPQLALYFLPVVSSIPHYTQCQKQRFASANRFGIPSQRRPLPLILLWSRRLGSLEYCLTQPWYAPHIRCNSKQSHRILRCRHGIRGQAAAQVLSRTHAADQQDCTDLSDIFRQVKGMARSDLIL